MHLTLTKAPADAVRPGMEVPILYHQGTLGHGAGLENQPEAVR